MSPRDWLDRIEDILTCIRNIQSFTAGMNFDEFSADIKTVRAVAFEFTTLGEASRAVPEGIQKKFSQIPWDKMQDMRNVIIHGYYRLDENILWETIREDLPPLRTALESILVQGESS